MWTHKILSYWSCDWEKNSASLGIIFDECTSKIEGLQNYWLLFDGDCFLPEHDIYLLMK